MGGVFHTRPSTFYSKDFDFGHRVMLNLFKLLFKISGKIYEVHNFFQKLVKKPGTLYIYAGNTHRAAFRTENEIKKFVDFAKLWSKQFSLLQNDLNNEI